MKCGNLQFLLLAGSLFTSIQASAAMPVDPAALDARCLIVVDAAAKPGNFQDMRLAMMRGFFAGRVMARGGKQAGLAAVEQARKDMRDPALAPSQASCGAVLDGYLAQAYPG